jgi:hypothetical protein
MEFWLFHRFYFENRSLKKTLKWLYDDFITWFSKPWREHRKHEEIMTFNEISRLYSDLFEVIELYKINDRAFLMLGQPKF